MAIPTMFRDMFNTLNETTESANAIARQIKSRTEDVDDQVSTRLNESTDEEIVSAREKIAAEREKIAKRQEQVDAAEDNLREKIRAEIADADDFDVDAAKAKYLEARGKVTAMKSGLAAFIGSDWEDNLDDNETLTELIGFRGTRKTTGTGVSRSSFSEVSVNGTALDTATLTAAAQHITREFGKVGAGDLRESLEKQHAGYAEKIGESLSFQHNVNRKNGDSVTVNISVTPTENVRRPSKSDASDSE